MCERREERSVYLSFLHRTYLASWIHTLANERERERGRETIRDVCSVYATHGRTKDGSVDHSLKLATNDEQIYAYNSTFEMLDESVSSTEVQV